MEKAREQGRRRKWRCAKPLAPHPSPSRTRKQVVGRPLPRGRTGGSSRSPHYQISTRGEATTV
ncbi:hypothetical protein E2C01_015044 [Portunus trituberculatus]|uniref:Uncharacterized protein n=1 Tax=Portunus trituberculatus TaxID=210409 RepID=A0A5B7DKR8_PORTR|nr:hypothetical protein [Portunus trituberculatus]